MNEIFEIAEQFDIPGRIVSVEECRAGHINSTYFITVSDGTKYVLQRINTAVFKDPDGLMDNIFAVTGHLRKKLAGKGLDPERGTLRFIPAKNGRKYCRTESGAFRVYRFIDRVVSLQSAETPDTLRSVGVAFGGFAMMLADFDASTLSETIPHFHDTESRLKDLLDSVAADPIGRAKEVEKEIGFVLERKDYCSYIVSRLRSGELPLRVTHNDTKLNNILLDEKTLAPVCVIDLDTVMPGSVLYDFGDAVRFAASTDAEDSDDYENVRLDEDKFSALAKGFYEGFDGTISPAELSAFPLGALIITLETGMRFLKDYIDGDVYFRTAYPGHNLVRARNQFALVSDIQSKLARLSEAVEKL